MKSKILSGILSLSLLGSASASQAALFDRGNGLIYDSTLNITWLQDANYAKTSGYEDADVYGRMNWDDAMTWAEQLQYGGFDDWRLPGMMDTGTPGCNWSSNGTDCGYNVQTGSAATTVYSEMASLWFDTLGNKAFRNTDGDFTQFGWGLKHTGPFSNIGTPQYWSGEEYALNANDAWDFGTLYGGQVNRNKTNRYYAWAVRDGDVAPVPLPAAAWLFGSALLGLVGLRRRQAKRA